MKCSRVLGMRICVMEVIKTEFKCRVDVGLLVEEEVLWQSVTDQMVNEEGYEVQIETN